MVQGNADMTSDFNEWYGPNTRAFDVVRAFESRVAAYAGAKYGVAVATGTWAIFLSCRLLKVKEVVLPARTFISVPMAVLDAGGTVRFQDYPWGGIYQLAPYPIWDACLRWHRGMYHGGLHCMSFQARKSLPIGEGGMILTDDRESAEWLRAAAYCGRRPPDYRIEDVTERGWLAYMTPAKAAQGLHLMEYTKDAPDQRVIYQDLRKAPLFTGATAPTA